MPCSPKLRRFGRDLKHWLYDTKGAWDILPHGYASWVSGGCWILARALHYWVGRDAELVAIYSWPEFPSHDNEKMPQHVVLRIGGPAGCYLDGDGASTEKDLLSRWISEEGLDEPEIDRVVAEELDEYDIHCPIGSVKDLTKALQRRFGDAERILDT